MSINLFHFLLGGLDDVTNTVATDWELIEEAVIIASQSLLENS